MECVVVNLPQDDGEQWADGPSKAGVVVLGVAEADLRETREPNEHAEDDEAQPEQLLRHQPQGYNSDMKESRVVVGTTGSDVLNSLHD